MILPCLGGALHREPVPVAKRMYWLAWKACGSASGMGALQDRESVDEEQVWHRILEGGDNGRHFDEYPVPLHRLYADYVFGRMMKCAVRVREDSVEFPDDPIRGDYQGWASTYALTVSYPSYEALAKAAISDLEDEAQRGEVAR